MASTKPKSKLAYLSYDQIQTKIDQGILDQYDLVYEKNEHILYIIDKDMNIVPVESKIDSFQSESEALEYINSHTDTYPGKIINIYEEDKFIPYIVNLNASTGDFYVLPVSTISDDHDYNHLFNKPIENIVATDEVILANLDDGIYSLVGNYRISDLDTTHRMITSKELFIKQTATEEDNIEYVYITEINSKNVKRYICTDESFIEDRYILFSELGNEVDDIIQVEVPVIVDNMIQTEVPGMISDYIDNHSASTEDIRNLFNS